MKLFNIPEKFKRDKMDKEYSPRGLSVVEILIVLTIFTGLAFLTLALGASIVN